MDVMNDKFEEIENEQLAKTDSKMRQANGRHRSGLGLAGPRAIYRGATAALPETKPQEKTNSKEQLK